MSSLYERRLQKSRLLSKPTIILALRFFWVIVIIWCEFGVFYSLSECTWPDKLFQSTTSLSDVKPTRVLLVADARLRNPADSVTSSWFGYNPSSVYLRKSWSVVSRLRPNVVMFLGDTLASGRYVTSEAVYDRYYRAFEATFPRDPSVPLYFIPGSNDIGLGDSPSVSKDARRFFEERFGPLNQVVTISGHTFVLLDAPGLVEEDYRRHARGQTYDQWTPLSGGPIEFLQSISNQEDGHAVGPRILLSHIPLSRPYSQSCGPLREKASMRAGAGHGYPAMFCKQATEFLLKSLRPSVVFSGEKRDYCEIAHEMPGSDLHANTMQSSREVAVKSFSPSGHIGRPGFQLLSLVPPSSASPTGFTFADAPCHLPDTLRAFRSIYSPCLVLTALLLLYLNIGPSRYGIHFSTLSPISSTRFGRSSSPPEPESVIWATRTPLKSRVRTGPAGLLPLSAHIPSANSNPSYRAFPISSPQGSPLLSPLTLFPSGDEADAEAGQIGPCLSHYNLRRDLEFSSGWQGEDDDALSQDHTWSAHPSHPVAPLSHRTRPRWACSWSLVLGGRRRRMTIAMPNWKVWPGRLHKPFPNRIGLVWMFANDCVSVALPAVVARAVVGWLFF